MAGAPAPTANEGIVGAAEPPTAAPVPEAKGSDDTDNALSPSLGRRLRRMV